MAEQIQDSEWFIQTVSQLRSYRVLRKRIEVIEIQLLKQAGPDAKAIANYGAQIHGGQNPDEISELEVEMEEKQRRLETIDKSIEALDEQERKIIELKFKQGYCDRRIYEADLPMSSRTFYGYYNEAITKIAKCLGLLGC